MYEWSHFLTGLFAPLAFVWLLALVWVQATGLRQQRNELALTRREIADNRAAIRTQADATRNQAKFIGEQTEVLKEDRAAAAAERVFEAHVAQLTLWLRHYPQALEVRSSGNKRTLAVVSEWENELPQP